jgi:drug/metabolite transporter superfamily protein YnfA
LIFSIISFAVSMFISDKFKLSNNKLIKILQKLVFINIILVFIGFILYIFDIEIFGRVYASDGSQYMGENKHEVNNNKDVAQITSNIDDKNDEYYNFKIKKDIFDNAMERSKDIVVEGAKNIGPSLGISAAAGKAAAEAFKHTSGMAIVPRILVAGSTALATAVGTKIGLELGKAATENKTKILRGNVIDGSKLKERDTDGSHLPSDFGGGFINDPLEDNVIPLIIMVNGLSYLNYIEFSLILTLFSLLLRKYLNRKIQSFILKLKNKYINKNKEGHFPTPNHEVEGLSHPKQFGPSAQGPFPTGGGERGAGENINNENITLNKAFNAVDKYTNYLIVFIFICLIWIMFINIYFSSNLAENIDSYVKVYNHIKGNSLFGLFFYIKNEYIVIKNKVYYSPLSLKIGLPFTSRKPSTPPKPRSGGLRAQRVCGLGPAQRAQRVWGCESRLALLKRVRALLCVLGPPKPRSGGFGGRQIGNFFSKL